MHFAGRSLLLAFLLFPRLLVLIFPPILAGLIILLFRLVAFLLGAIGLVGLGLLGLGFGFFGLLGFRLGNGGGFVTLGRPFLASACAAGAGSLLADLAHQLKDDLSSSRRTIRV